jgi:hypothetical protein
VWACGLISLVDYIKVITCDVWEGNVTTRRDVLNEHICSLLFQDIREEVTLQRMTLCRLGCTMHVAHWFETWKDQVNLMEPCSIWEWWQAITLFKSMTMLCGADNVVWNIPHVQFECEKYFVKYC